MDYKYSQLDSLTREEFLELTNRKGLSENDIVISDDHDIAKIENILDLNPGALKGVDFKVQKTVCECGHVFTFYDFVFTALVEQWHDSSFMAHTLLGRKYLVNKPRAFRCSACGARSEKVIDEWYDMPHYGCCGHV